MREKTNQETIGTKKVRETKAVERDPRIFSYYSREEETVNMLTHIVGIVLGVVVLFMCMMRAMLDGDDWKLASGVIYGVSMILLYTVSSIYHGWESEYKKKVLRIVDHCTIYLLIAGTITPICMNELRMVNPTFAWVLFGVVYATNIIGIVFTAIDFKKYILLSMFGYLAPWLMLFIINDLITAYSINLVWYLVGGGAAYTIGAVCYGIGKKKIKYMHATFHIFILLGSLIHFIGIYDCCFV